MQHIASIPLEIDYTVDTTETSKFPAWSSSSWYWRGQGVYRATTGHNYRALYFHFSSSTPPESLVGDRWEDLGPTKTVVYSYTTNASVSLYKTWVSGEDLKKGARRYDPNDGYDYMARSDIDSSDNTAEPSAMIQSLDETESGYWQQIGRSNIFRLVDNEAWYTAVKNGTFTVTLNGDGYADDIQFSGLKNVKTIEAVVNAGEMIDNWDFASDIVGAWRYSDTSTVSASSGDLTIDNDSASEPALTFLILEVTPGVEYDVVIYLTSTSNIECSVRTVAYSTVHDQDTIAGSNVSTTLTVPDTNTENRIRINMTVPAGASNSAAIHSVSCKQKSHTQETLTINLTESTLNPGTWPTVARGSHTACHHPEYALTFTPQNEALTVEVGLVSAGKAVTLGNTQEPMSLGGQSYSVVDYDDEFATLKFQRRAHVRTITAKIRLQGLSTDEVDRYLWSQYGLSGFFDLNNGGTDNENMMVAGFIKNHEVDRFSVTENNYFEISITGVPEG